jgi:hypothetical protein
MFNRYRLVPDGPLLEFFRADYYKRLIGKGRVARAEGALY